MQYVTKEASELSQLLDKYKAIDQQPAAWLKATSELIGFATRLRGQMKDVQEVVRAFEIGLVLRTRSNDFRKSADPLAEVIWELLYRQALDIRAAAGEATEYIEAVLRALGEPEAGDRAIYELTADLASHALSLLAPEDDPGLDDLSLAELVKRKLSFVEGLAFFTTAARLLIANDHSVLGFKAAGQCEWTHTPLTDLVYYDWGWGVEPDNDRFLPADPETCAEPNRPRAAPGTVWRNRDGETVGSPLRRGDRIPLSRFNVDVLLNLAVWKVGREDAQQPPAVDLKSLWEKLTSGAGICSFGSDLDQVDRQLLVDIPPHINHTIRETDTEAAAWPATKVEWQRRKDVIEEGYAIRYWGANNSFLNYLFRSWEWIASAPQLDPNLPEAFLPHNWPAIPTLIDFAGEDNDPVDADEHVLANWWNQLAHVGGAATVEATKKWNNCEAKWITIGASGSGKTWLDMAILDSVKTFRPVGNGIVISRGTAAIQLFETLYDKWVDNVRAETQAGEKADLKLSSTSQSITHELTLLIEDDPGEEFNLDRLFQGARPTEIFLTLVAPRLQEAGAVGIVIDCERLLIGGVEPFAERECLLLEECDRNDGMGLHGTPLAIVLTKADALGVREPLGVSAALLEHALPDGADVKHVLGAHFRRLAMSRQVQHQFVTHRLYDRLWRLLKQAVSGRDVNRLTGVFLTCGLHSEVARPAGEVTGAMAYADWVARHVMHRWLATISGKFAVDLEKGIDNVLAVVRPIRAELRAARRRFNSLIPSRRRSAYNRVIDILNQEFDAGLAPAPEDRKSLPPTKNAHAGVERYDRLVAIYEHAAQEVELAFPGRRPNDWEA